MKILARTDLFCKVCKALGIPTPTILAGQEYFLTITAHGFIYAIGGDLEMSVTQEQCCLDCYWRFQEEKKLNNEKRTLPIQQRLKI